MTQVAGEEMLVEVEGPRVHQADIADKLHGKQMKRKWNKEQSNSEWYTKCRIGCLTGISMQMCGDGTIFSRWGVLKFASLPFDTSDVKFTFLEQLFRKISPPPFA